MECVCNDCGTVWNVCEMTVGQYEMCVQGLCDSMECVCKDCVTVWNVCARTVAQYLLMCLYFLFADFQPAVTTVLVFLLQ